MVTKANGPPKGARKRQCASQLVPRKPNSAEALRPAPEGARKLGSKLLTTATTTRAQKFAATDSGFACKESVATLAHEIAGLEGPLHVFLEYLNGVATEQSCLPLPRPIIVGRFKNARSGARSYGNANHESSRVAHRIASHRPLTSPGRASGLSGRRKRWMGPEQAPEIR